MRKPLLISAVGHAFLAGVGLVAAVAGHKPVVWGESSPGGAATVRLVSAASVPLPAPLMATKNRVATENPGLHFPEPVKPEPPQEKTASQTPAAPEKAIELPAPNAKVVPEPAKKAAAPEKPIPPPSRNANNVDRRESRPRQEARLRRPVPETPAGNEIPFGEGGPAQGPYGIFQTEAGSGGFAFKESAGGFAERYGWYVTAMRNRIGSNWLKGTVDPNIRVAPRVYVAFQILREGQIVNAQLTASSGISSLDRSALRAIYDSNPMPPLPADYLGPSVAVEFWFDFRR